MSRPTSGLPERVCASLIDLSLARVGRLKVQISFGILHSPSPSGAGRPSSPRSRAPIWRILHEHLAQYGRPIVSAAAAGVRQAIGPEAVLRHAQCRLLWPKSCPNELEPSTKFLGAPRMKVGGNHSLTLSADLIGDK